MAVEYACEGCGVCVVALCVSQPPAHGFCVQCAFLCDYIPDPVEMMAVRKALDADRKDDAGLTAIREWLLDNQRTLIELVGRKG